MNDDIGSSARYVLCVFVMLIVFINFTKLFIISESAQKVLFEMTLKFELVSFFCSFASGFLFPSVAFACVFFFVVMFQVFLIRELLIFRILVFHIQLGYCKWTFPVPCVCLFHLEPMPAQLFLAREMFCTGFRHCGQPIRLSQTSELLIYTYLMHIRLPRLVKFQCKLLPQLVNKAS